MRLQFQKDLCTGCKLCQLACSATHDRVFNPEKSRIKIIHEYKQNDIHITARYCTFCRHCEEACPEGAISQNGLWMIVDRDRCVGCEVCVEECPMKVIFMDSDAKAVICDLCGGSPQCVEWCPTGAITAVGKNAPVSSGASSHE